jgi:hypothetical protein
MSVHNDFAIELFAVAAAGRPFPLERYRSAEKLRIFGGKKAWKKLQ